MKKFICLFMVMALSFGMLVSCGSSGESDEAQSDTDSSTGTEDTSDSATEEDEYVEPMYATGIVTGIDGDIVTIDSEDGGEVSIDISASENTDTEYLMTGCYADAEYTEGEDGDNQATYFSVLMNIEQQADAEGRDPVLYGTLESMDANDLYIVDETGEERLLDNQISRTISFDDISEGDTVAVAYYGTIFDYSDGEEDESEEGAYSDSYTYLPVALKVMSLDAINSEEAQANYISGTVDRIYSDGVIEIYNNVTTFTFNADQSLLEGIDQEDHVRVYYEGAFGGRTTTATRIEVEE